MQARNAASVFPEPVGAEISVVRPARICGQPCSCGSVGVPNRWTNHSLTRGWAHARESGRDCIFLFYRKQIVSPSIRPVRFRRVAMYLIEDLKNCRLIVRVGREYLTDANNKKAHQ